MLIRALRLSILVVATLVWAVACDRCAEAPSGLPVAPDAVAVVEVPSLPGSLATLTQALQAFGLDATSLPSPSTLALGGVGDAAGALVSVRKDGGLVVALSTSNPTLLLQGLKQEGEKAGLTARSLGDAWVFSEASAAGPRDAFVVVSGAGVVLASFAGDDTLAAATLLSTLLASQAPRRTMTAPSTGLIARAHILDAASAAGLSKGLGVTGGAGELSFLPAGLVLRAELQLDDATRAAAAELASPSPASSCALDEGAVAVLRLPAVAADRVGPALGADSDDAFVGRVAVGIYPTTADVSGGSALDAFGFALVGAPKRPDSVEELLAALQTVGQAVPGGRVGLLRKEGGRALAVAAGPGLIGYGFGVDTAPLARALSTTTCPPEPPGLVLRADGPTVAGAIVRASADPVALLRTLLQGEAGAVPAPLRALQNAGALTVTALPTPGGATVVVSVPRRVVTE